MREANLRLEAERLTERSNGRGFVVARITREEMQAYAVRGALDGVAARLAAHGILPPSSIICAGSTRSCAPPRAAAITTK